MPTAKTTKSAKISRNLKTTTAPIVEAGNLSELLQALPSPEELARYEKIIPGGAERILELAEQQTSHRQAIEARQLETSVRSTRIRQAITFVLALSAALLGGALLLQGSELAGLMIILVDALAVVTAAVYGRKITD